MTYPTNNLRIKSSRIVVPPIFLEEEMPVTENASRTVFEARRQIVDILNGTDDRLVVVVGPCSIHDPAAAREYAGLLKNAIADLSSDLMIVMRVYFEKPRTTLGWKGLINDPYFDDSFRISDGLRMARRLLLDLAEMSVPAGTEYLDMISPQYVSDLVSWGAIGARTTESQVHRELASGLSCPVGFKNSTDGSLQVAIDAIRSASKPHHFLSVTKAGHSAIFSTAGNPDCHIILRGGRKPNYDAKSLDEAAEALGDAGLPAHMMIDCSHGNSRKDPAKQVDVAHSVARQVASGDRRIMGVMLESHLVAGRQDLVADKPLVYGQSITDACMNWDDTIPVLRDLAAGVRERRSKAS